MVTNTAFDVAVWLAKLCIPDNIVGPNAQHLHRPLRWRDMAVATNGKALVAIRGLRLAGAEPVSPVVFMRLENYLGHKPPGATAMIPQPMADLKRWLGPATYLVPCLRCKGDTWPQNRHGDYVCTNCDGTGETAPEVERVSLYGVHVDRHLLAWYLEGVEADWVTLTLTEGPIQTDRGTVAGPLYLDAADWRVVVMPLAVPHPDSPVACYPDPPLSAEALGYVTRATADDRGVVADWLEEHGHPHLAAVWRATNA